MIRLELPHDRDVVVTEWTMHTRYAPRRVTSYSRSTSVRSELDPRETAMVQRYRRTFLRDVCTPFVRPSWFQRLLSDFVLQEIAAWPGIDVHGRVYFLG